MFRPFFPELVMSTDLLSFEHPLVLLFCFVLSGSKIVKRFRRRKYNPLIIEKTICLVLGPSTVLYRSILKRCNLTYKQKQKYRGMFETQKSRNKTSSGDIDLNIRTLASPKVGHDQVSGGVSVLCWHAAPVANDGPCINHRRGERVLMTVPSDC